MNPGEIEMQLFGNLVEPDLGSRKKIAAGGVVFVLAGAEAASILADRLFAGSAAAWASHAGIALVATAAIVGIGKRAFCGPLRQAYRRVGRAERLCRTIVRDSADFVCLFGPKGTVAIEGDAVESTLGYTGGEMRAGRLSAFVHREDLGAAIAGLRALGPERPRVPLTIRLRRKDGREIWADVCLRRIGDGTGRPETIATVRDVTRRHREAEALRETTLVAERARAEADQASRSKSEFLACMSHEIRSPLNSVIGFADLLLDRADLPQPVRLYGERIRAAGRALLTVVDDILDFSRVEAGALELVPAPFSMPSLVDECVSIVQQEAVAKNLSLHVSLIDRLPAAVVGDAARLRQVLLNLLYNAIKFTHEGSVLLEIRYDRSPVGGERMRFSVVDTGIGIAGEDIPRLFQRFAQVDGSIKRLYGGTGLGLAISKRLVELMGGTIGVESEWGVGSTFWLTLPLPAQDRAPQSLPAEPKPATSPRRILLVDDVAMNQDLVSHILGAAGHTVDIVGNGAEAIMAVQDTCYDVVLMDIQMPYLDGLTTTRRIRELPSACSAVPIVAMTANALPEQNAAAREAGMAEVIHKPFSAAQIHAVIERLTGHKDALVAPAEADGRVLAKLAGLIGDAKTKGLMTSLAASLASRFEADPETTEGRTILRRQAHASVAGSGMLGFEAFAAACKAFEAAPDDDAFAGLLAALRREAAQVIATAQRLAASPDHLATAIIAA